MTDKSNMTERSEMTGGSTNPKRPHLHPPFKKGNPGGPGNPFAGQVNRYRKSILKAGTPEQAVEIMRGLYEIAVNESEPAKNRTAAGMAWLSYVAGPPQKMHEQIAGETADRGKYTFIFLDQTGGDDMRRRVANIIEQDSGGGQ